MQLKLPQGIVCGVLGRSLPSRASSGLYIFLADMSSDLALLDMSGTIDACVPLKCMQRSNIQLSISCIYYALTML